MIWPSKFPTLVARVIFVTEQQISKMRKAIDILATPLIISNKLTVYRVCVEAMKVIELANVEYKSYTCYITVQPPGQI